MKKTFLIMIAIIVILITLICMLFLNKQKLSDNISDFINTNCDENNVCTFNMNEITDFKWDKMLMYQVGSSSYKIGKALDIDFKESVDVSSGIIFVYENKIVYNEQITFDPDRPSKLFFYPGPVIGENEYRVFTINDSIFEGRRKTDGKNICFTIIPIETNSSITKIS